MTGPEGYRQLVETYSPEVVQKLIEGTKKRKKLYILICFLLIAASVVVAMLLGKVNYSGGMFYVVIAVLMILGILLSIFAGFAINTANVITFFNTKGNAWRASFIYVAFFSILGGIIIPLIVNFICFKISATGVWGWKSVAKKLK